MKSGRELVCWKCVSIQCDFCSCLCVWGNPCLCLIFVQSVVCGLTFSVQCNYLSSLGFWSGTMALFGIHLTQSRRSKSTQIIAEFVVDNRMCFSFFGFDLIWNSAASVVYVGAGVPLCLFEIPDCVCMCACVLCVVRAAREGLTITKTSTISPCRYRQDMCARLIGSPCLLCSDARVFVC